MECTSINGSTEGCKVVHYEVSALWFLTLIWRRHLEYNSCGGFSLFLFKFLHCTHTSCLPAFYVNTPCACAFTSCSALYYSTVISHVTHGVFRTHTRALGSGCITWLTMKRFVAAVMSLPVSSVGRLGGFMLLSAEGKERFVHIWRDRYVHTSTSYKKLPLKHCSAVSKLKYIFDK